jgi:hypothetical protein
VDGCQKAPVAEPNADHESRHAAISSEFRGMAVSVRLGGRPVRVNYSLVQSEVADLHTEGWSYALIAERCEVSARTLRRFLAGRPVSGRSLDRILSGLGLAASDVITYLPEGRA